MVDLRGLQGHFGSAASRVFAQKVRSLQSMLATAIGRGSRTDYYLRDMRVNGVLDGHTVGAINAVLKQMINLRTPVSARYIRDNLDMLAQRYIQPWLASGERMAPAGVVPPPEHYDAGDPEDIPGGGTTFSHMLPRSWR